MSIEDYKFEDEDVDHTRELTYNKVSGIVEIIFCNGNALHLFKNDVIALAKHFKLTSKDLF